MNVRQFLESLSSTSIVSSNELTTIRGLPGADQEEADAEALVRKLIEQGKLTKFQAINLYQGRAKGLVFGEYVVLDKLGAGGMGQVYKAQHRRMKRVVALKVLPPHAVNSQKAVNRFYQEVEVAAKVTHPNIVTAYDAGESRGLHYLVMEYVEGRDLSSYLNEHGPLGVEQALNVILQAARGLAYAHGLGIVHRDIKPANLLLDRHGTVKVLDMGLARIDNPLADAAADQNELTASGEVMGTVDYMSPEQAQDTRTADHRSDIYALGCTLYRLLTGKVPYPGDTTIKKILAHREQPIPSLRAERPEVPEMLDRLLHKMLAKNVAERTPTMAAVVSSLEKMLSGVDDDRSSIAVNPTDDAGDDVHFNFLQAGAGASGVLPGMSSVGKGPGGSKSGGSKGSGGLSAGSTGSGSLAGASGAHRALPQSIGGATPTSASAIPAGAVFPSMPATAGPKVAKAKRLAPGDTDDGGNTRGDGDATGAHSRKAGSSLPPGRKRAVIIGVAGGAVLAVVIAAIVLSLVGSDSEVDDGPQITPEMMAARKAYVPPPDASATATASSAPTASPTPSVPEPKLPDLSAAANPGDPAMFFGVENPAPSATGSASPSVSPTASARPQPPKKAGPLVEPSGPITAEKDLLALVDPETMRQHGIWKREGEAIVCESVSGPAPRVLVPFAPSGEYDVVCTAVVPDNAVQFGVGIVVDGRQAMLVAQADQGGLGYIDGQAWYHGNNPTRVIGKLFAAGEPVELRIAVRRGRIYADLNGKPTVDFFGGPERFTPLEASWNAPPGLMLLHGNTNAKFTKLSVGPPAMTLPPPPSAVNFAAAFDKAQSLIEGEATPQRNEIVVNPLPGKATRMSFPIRRMPDYDVRLVVERTTGDEFVCLGVPLGYRRVGVILDWTSDKVAGLQSITGGGANVNSTGQRIGMLLTPGSQHVVKVQVRMDPKGRRIRLTVDGRKVFDYAGDDFHDSNEAQVPDPAALSLTCYSTGLRILRYDASPAGVRLPPPASVDREKAAAAIRSATASASAKGAPSDAKLLAVDSLRRRAADGAAEPALRYVALEEALRLAAEAGDLPGAYEAAEDLATTFDVDRSTLTPKIVETFGAPRPKADAKQRFSEDALNLMARAAHDEQWDLAADMAAALDKSLGTSAADVKREVRARMTEYGLAKKLNTARAPDGGKPNPTAEGRYACFAVADWRTGLPLLAQSDDAGLRAVATMEAGELKSGEQLYALAEKWWELAENEKDTALKWYEIERAAYWYQEAAPLLSGNARQPLQRKATLLTQQRKLSNGAGGPRRPLDAVMIGGRWYKYYSAGLSWPMAERTCKQLGGRLAVVDSPQRNQALAELALKSAGGDERVVSWIGLNDLANEGGFVTVDGRAVVPPFPSNWAPGQPDNQGGGEDAVVLEAKFESGKVTGLWYDWNASQGYPFLCEWDR